MEQDDRERAWRVKFEDDMVRSAIRHLKQGCQTLLTLRKGSVDTGSLNLLRMYIEQIKEQLQHLEAWDDEEDEGKEDEGDLMDKTRAAYSRYLS